MDILENTIEKRYQEIFIGNPQKRKKHEFLEVMDYAKITRVSSNDYLETFFKKKKYL